MPVRFNKPRPIKPSSRPQNAEKEKPEWLKQWTISKGWMHNRSHLLTLGKTNRESSDQDQDQDNSSTSMSIGNVDDLLSLASDNNSEKDDAIETERSEGDAVRIKHTSTYMAEVISNVGDSVRIKRTYNKHTSDEHVNERTVCSKRDEDTSNELTVEADVYGGAFENYRKKFPESKFSATPKADLALPEIYKERLLRDSGTNFFKRLWCRSKKRNKSLAPFRFTVNALYDSAEFGHEDNCKDDYEDLQQQSSKRNSIGRNIAIFNTLNSKTNLHEDPIYECSEDDLSVYNNPIYSPASRYFGFHTNRVGKEENGFFRAQDEADAVYEQISCCRRKLNQEKRRMRTEKHIIRHIRVRIMLTLRLKRKFRLLQRGEVFSRNGDRVVKDRIKDLHEEQQRIGNGRDSMKIQNMR